MAQSLPLYQRPKPRLRGRLHEIAFFVAIPAGLVLIVLAPGPIARAGAIVYWLALLSQFGVSAWYHLGKWSERAHERMRRLDHSTIFLLIAGTYTPFCLLALHGTASLVLLAVVWIADTAAYVFGRTFGRHKLAPAISPGKTWEGVTGALATVAVYALALNLAQISGRDGGFLVAAFLSMTVFSVVGDLFESWMKRSAGVKDSGAILPGHGGLLDRIDGVMAALPLAALIFI